MHSIWILVLAYLIGSVPTGYILSSVSGIDIRGAGSGNIGATNVGRVVGWKAGLVTLLADAGKGFIPVFLTVQTDFDPEISVLTALAAFLGHLYPVFLKFKGGKGVATALGCLTGLDPLIAGYLALAFLVIVLATRWVSLGSICAAALAPPLFWYFTHEPSYIWMSLFMALLIIVRHRENIQRILSGAESRFEMRRQGH